MHWGRCRASPAKMPKRATGWRAPTRRWGLRRTRNSSNLFPTPGALTNFTRKASPFVRIPTVLSKSIRQRWSCVLARQNFTKRSGNFTSTITLTVMRRVSWSAPRHSLYLLGRLYVQNRDNERAVPYLQRALLLQPDLAEASELLGTAYVRLGQFANAVPRLEKAAPRDHYGNVHYQLYLAYHKLGRNELAKKALSRSQELRRSSLERDQALILGSPQPQPDPQ